MMTSPAFTLEKRLFLFSMPGLILVLAMSLLGGLAILNGAVTVERTIAAQTVFLSNGEQVTQDWLEELVSIEKGGAASAPTAARPMHIRMPAILPPAPLAGFAASSSDLYPSTTTLTPWANPVDLFMEYEFSNPTLSSIGGFDLTFLVVVLIPLIMIGASFDIFAADRERGRSRIIAVQSGHVGPSIWMRLIIRNLFIWSLLTLILALAVICMPSIFSFSERLLSFCLWWAVAALYGLFWFALIAFAIAFLKRSETVAALLFASWAIFVFAIPAIGNGIAEASYPPPSRLAFLSEMREGEVKAIRDSAELTAGFLADHPELIESDEAVPSFYQSNFLANLEVTKRTMPALDAYNKSRQQRDSLTDKIQYFSPAMMTNAALKTLAGGDVNRNMAFQNQARQALRDLSETVGPAVISKKRISVSEFESIPAFKFQEKSVSQMLNVFMSRLLIIFLLTIVLLIAAYQRLKSSLEYLL